MILKELLTTDVGLMSLAAVIVTAGIGVFMYFRIRAMIRAEAKPEAIVREDESPR